MNLNEEGSAGLAVYAAKQVDMWANFAKDGSM
jgi:hypothetical protein